MNTTTTVRSFLVHALVAVALAAFPQPAEAAEPCTGDYATAATESLCWPVPTGTTIALTGPRRIWKLRDFARRVDAQLPQLTVRSVASCTPGGAEVCVNVVRELREDVGWAGLTTWTVDPNTHRILAATIHLNLVFGRTDAKTKRHVAAHEFMHVLGFAHHTGTGQVTQTPVLSRTPAPGPVEWQLLHQQYG